MREVCARVTILFRFVKASLAPLLALTIAQ